MVDIFGNRGSINTTQQNLWGTQMNGLVTVSKEGLASMR